MKLLISEVAAAVLATSVQAADVTARSGGPSQKQMPARNAPGAPEGMTFFRPVLSGVLYRAGFLGGDKDRTGLSTGQRQALCRAGCLLRGVEHTTLAHRDAAWGGRQPSHLGGPVTMAHPVGTRAPALGKTRNVNVPHDPISPTSACGCPTATGFAQACFSVAANVRNGGSRRSIIKAG